MIKPSDRVRVYVVSHRDAWFPSGDVYVPIQVGKGESIIGADGKPILRDDTEDNISRKNPNYCELTALYWILRNTDEEFVGIAHYRRHYKKNGIFFDKHKAVADEDTLREALQKSDIILPRSVGYGIFNTAYTQYKEAHCIEDMDRVREIINRKCPEYSESFEKAMNLKRGHLFNMSIMPRNLFNGYCEWLFSILFEAEKAIDLSTHTGRDVRVFGYLAERLLDVWVIKNKVSYSELPFVFLDEKSLQA